MSEFKEKRDDEYTTYFMGWQDSWQAAITDPSDETYEKIITDPQATSGRAFSWIAGAAAVAAVINVVGSMMFGADVQVASLICLVPIAPVFAIIGLVIFGGIVNIIAKAMDGQGKFDELINGFAAVQSPMAIISAVLGVIPAIGLPLSGLVSLYSLYLGLKVTKVVHQFGWGKAAIAYFAIIFLAICAVVCLIVILGGSIADVFSEIQATMEAGG